jgi:hypothetical protein
MVSHRRGLQFLGIPGFRNNFKLKKNWWNVEVVFWAAILHHVQWTQSEHMKWNWWMCLLQMFALWTLVSKTKLLSVHNNMIHAWLFIKVRIIIINNNNNLNTFTVSPITWPAEIDHVTLLPQWVIHYCHCICKCKFLIQMSLKCWQDFKCSLSKVGRLVICF